MTREKKLKLGMMVLASVLTLNSAFSNEIVNGGFEETIVWTASNPYFKGLKDNEWTLPDPFLVPKGWVINAGTMPKGEGVFRLVTEDVKFDTTCVFLKGDMYAVRGIKVQEGDEIIVSVWSKDPEEKTGSVGVRLYGYGTEKGVTKFVSSLQAWDDGSAEWKNYDFKFTVPGPIDNVRINNVAFAISSMFGAYFDNVSVSVKRTQNQ